MAVELAEIVLGHLYLPVKQMTPHSRVVLGYLNNRARIVFIYVENKINRYLKSTASARRNYVSTKDNPANFSTRPTPVHILPDSMWLQGPSFFHKDPVAMEQLFAL